MVRLPNPGGDQGDWGHILNEYLSQSHENDGSLKPDTVGSDQIKDKSITSVQLADNSITEEQLSAPLQSKLDSFSSSSLSTETGSSQEIVFAQGFGTVAITDDTQFIDGTHIFLDTLDGAVYLTLDLGIVVLGPTTAGTNVAFEMFIRDASNNETFAYNLFTSPNIASDGFTAAKQPAMIARIPKGRAMTHFVGVISGASTNTTAQVDITLNPTWTPEGTAFASLRAERV